MILYGLPYLSEKPPPIEAGEYVTKYVLNVSKKWIIIEMVIKFGKKFF